jgi:predicted PurR-regulated permease PerM
VATLQDSKTLRLVRILEATVLVVATLYFGRPILLPIAAAILLTFLFSLPVGWLERFKVPRIVAVLTVVILVFGLFAVALWQTTAQLSDLMLRLPQYEQNLRTKLHELAASESGSLRRLGETVSHVTTEIEQTISGTEQATQRAKESIVEPPPPLPVKIVADPNTPLETANSFLMSLLGPVTSLGAVTVLVIFMLMVREDLRDRLVRLAGTSQLTLTTRTMDEIGSRISRYLLFNALVNSGFGLIIGLGMFAIGVQYAALWGLLAAMLRFIPYLGAIVSSALPIGMAIVQFPTWMEPLMVIGLFIVAELMLDNVVEPLVYGRSAGVSAVALLMAAMFWGWIWGLPGLVLSVPMTVMLAVLGKYLTPLEPLWVLLGNEPTLPSSVRYYQRLLANDADEAADILENHSKDHSLVETFDEILLPALAQSERDRERGDISTEQEELIWNTTQQFVDELAAERDAEHAADEEPTAAPALVVGVPVLDRADEIALNMLAQVVPPHVKVEVIPRTVLAGELLTSFETATPEVVCISALGPGGVGQIRYLSKRVRQKFPQLPVIVGRWAFQGDAAKMIANTKERGATHVVTQLQQALEVIAKLQPGAASPEPVESLA